MNKTINELVALTELANDDELIVYDVSEGTSKKIKKSDFVTANIASGNLKPPTSNAVAKSISYSTQEIKTGGTWINGKPIYKKVIPFGNLPNNNTKTVVTDTVNVDTLIHIEAITYQVVEGVTYILPIPFASASSEAVFSGAYQIRLEARIENGVISTYIQTGIDRTSWSANIIVEYTKTAD